MRSDSRISTASCRRCAKKVINAVTSSGRRIVVNGEPDASGDVRLIYRRGDVPPEVRFVPMHEHGQYLPSEPWYLEHLCEVAR